MRRPRAPIAKIAFIFGDISIERTDDGRPLLEEAEAAGDTESGCRMGIASTCTRRKTSGVVKEPDHRRGVGIEAGLRGILRVCRSVTSSSRCDRKMTCEGDPLSQTLVECASDVFRELEEVPMTMVGGFDVHRKQITFDYVDDDGVVRR